MEPANILFVIAFIGLPLAFGIWALISRRELKRMSPPVRRQAPQVPPRQQQQPPQQAAQAASQQPQTQHTVQMPAADEGSLPQAPPPPRQPAPESEQTQTIPQFGYQPSPPPATLQPDPQPESTQETVQAPAVEPEPAQGSAHGEEPETSGRSGTTEEFPIIGYTEFETAPQDLAPAAPVESSTPQPSRIEPRKPRRFVPPRSWLRSAVLTRRVNPLGQRTFVAKRNPRNHRR